MTRRGALAVGLLAALTAASVPAGGPGAQLAPGGTAATVTIQTFQFRPTPLEVKAGTAVTWTNADDVQHTITSGTPDDRDGRFDGTLAGKNATFTHTFSQPGRYVYFCDRHRFMRGELRVD